MQLRYRESDDGLRLPLAPHDAVLGAGELVHTARGEDVVLPPSALAPNPPGLFYADAFCRRAYVRVEPGCAPPASFAEPGPILFATGDRATAPPGYAEAFGACEPLANVPDGDFYQVMIDSPVDPLEMTIERASTQHRVELQRAHRGDVVLRLRELYDTQLAAECVPRKFPDDVYRCAPDGAAELIGGLYSDAACSQLLEVARVLPGHRPPGLVLADRTLLGGTLKVFALDEPYIGPMFAFGGAGGTQCLAVDSLDLMYRTGRLVDWSELATATLSTD
jgi:hypothetical protein